MVLTNCDECGRETAHALGGNRWYCTECKPAECTAGCKREPTHEGECDGRDEGERARDLHRLLDEGLGGDDAASRDELHARMLQLGAQAAAKRSDARPT